jgi:hypothetical protein
MDLVAPGITCATTRQHYPLSEMRTVRIMQFEGVDAAYLWVTCTCGQWHNLPIGQLVDEARALPSVEIYSAGIPDLELVLTGVVDIPVDYDLNRPLSLKDQRRAEFMAYLLSQPDRVAQFEEELADMLSEADELVMSMFYDQLHNAAAWKWANWRKLFKASA